MGAGARFYVCHVDAVHHYLDCLRVGRVVRIRYKLRLYWVKFVFVYALLGEFLGHQFLHGLVIVLVFHAQRQQGVQPVAHAYRSVGFDVVRGRLRGLLGGGWFLYACSGVGRLRSRSYDGLVPLTGRRRCLRDLLYFPG